MFTVSIAVVGAADSDDPCGLALFPAYANFLNVYGETLCPLLEILKTSDPLLSYKIFCQYFIHSSFNRLLISNGYGLVTTDKSCACGA